MKPIIRFAPSPTGWLHIGNIRTALINWIFSQKNQGTFWLRMDDTDLERSKQEYIDGVKEDLTWLGLSWDQYTAQSDRLEFYKTAGETLKKLGRLYPCYETQEDLDFARKMQKARGKPPIYDRAALKLTPEDIQKLEAEGKKPHWRFKLNDVPVSWNDAIRGNITFNDVTFSDPVLIREDGMPVYTLASVADDIDLGITHIIRGEDHITNTAVQIQIFEALGKNMDELTFGHLQLITDISGQGFSKREGSLSIRSLRAQGIEPLAICAMLAKMGTSDSIEPKHYLAQLVEEFDFSKFGKSSPKFDLQELEMISRKTLHLLPFEEIEKKVDGISRDVWKVCGGNIEKVEDLHYWQNLLLDATNFEFTPFGENDKSILTAAIETIPDEFSEETWHEWAKEITSKTNIKGKPLFMALRLALTGKDKGPEMKDFICLLSPQIILQRLQSALKGL